MAFSKGAANLSIDGRRYKRVAVTAPSGDAHTTSQAYTFSGTVSATCYGMARDMVANPSEYGITKYVGADGQVRQDYRLTAITAAGFTITKDTAAAGAINQTLLVWFRVPRGITR